jgi:hypothetical protein
MMTDQDDAYLSADDWDRLGAAMFARQALEVFRFIRARNDAIAAASEARMVCARSAEE